MLGPGPSAPDPGWNQSQAINTAQASGGETAATRFQTSAEALSGRQAASRFCSQQKT